MLIRYIPRATSPGQRLRRLARAVLYLPTRARLFLDPAAPFILRRAAGRGALRFEKRPAQCRAAEKERAGEQNDRRAP